MGAQLSVSQEGVYYQVVGILAGGQNQFSKKEVKQFVRWLFLHFPNILAEKIHNLQFWDLVGNELLQLGH